MLDLRLFTSEPEYTRARLASRGVGADIFDEILRLDAERRRLVSVVEKLQAQRRTLAASTGRMRNQPVVNGARDVAVRDATARRDEGRALGESIKATTACLDACCAKLDAIVRTLPNLPHDSVPVGEDATANVLVRASVEPPTMPFTPRPHWELGEILGGLDVARGTALAGSRFYILSGDLAMLELALIMFMTEQHTRRRGYTPVIPPFLVNQAAMIACGQLPKFSDGLYHVPGDDLYLVPTAESALVSLHQGEILDAATLPRWYVGWSPCFRREAGSHGRDTRGIMRVHQFEKVELFKITTPETSYDEFEWLVEDAEHILRRLELPYRVMALSTGDMGSAAAKTYDLEVWLPSERAYREISSCSNCEDFQSRRANIRYRPGHGERPRFVHLLNGSGLAVGRTMVAILENFQQADGSVVVPAALRPHLGGLDRLRPIAARAVALTPGRALYQPGPLDSARTPKLAIEPAPA